MSREHDYAAIVKMGSFKRLQSARNRFIIPCTLFFFPFYLGLPILAGFTKVLTAPAIGSITWAWVYAFAQFIMTWTLCMLYSSKAKVFDKMTEDVLADVSKIESGKARRK